MKSSDNEYLVAVRECPIHENRKDCLVEETDWFDRAIESAWNFPSENARFANKVWTRWLGVFG